MTVADNTSRNQYTATSGQTVFAYTFEIVDKGDIVVLKNGTTLSEGTNYTVSNVGNDSGGNVTLTVGATTGDVLTLYRDMPYARTQNYTNSGDFLASEVNSDFDNLWLAGEQTNRSFSQSIRKPITDSDSISMELPEAATRANKFVKFDATGAVDVAGATVTVDAEDVSITDAGNYYTSGNVEGALQEVGASLDTKLENVVEDTTPQLGGNLDLNSNDITGTGNVNITGNVALSGTVDGRDVATDGTKLDGIEAGADVTDTANVTAAGAVMDSELTNEAAVKALNQGVATTDSPTFAGLTVDAVTYTGTDGTDGQVLMTDGAGNASFEDMPSSTYLDVTDFGATGDGSTDDTTAIQNAINHASNNEIQTIFFPDGHYKYTTLRFYHDATDNPNFQETPNRDGRFQLRGTGRLAITDLKNVGKSPNRIYGAILESTSTGDGLIVEPTGTFQTTTDARNFVVKDLTLVADNTGYIVTAESCPGLTFDHCSFKQLNHQGSGILARNCWFFTMNQCYVFGQSWIDEDFATAGQTEFSYTFDNPASTSDIIVQKKGGLVSSSDYSINTTTKVVTLNTGADLNDKVTISRKNTGDGISSQFVGSAFGSFAGLWNITDSLVDSWANGVHWTGGQVTNLSLRNTGVQNCNNYNIYGDAGVIQQMLLDNVYMENQSVQGVSFIKGDGSGTSSATIRNLRMINCFMLAGGTFPRVTGTCIDIDSIEVIDIEGMYVFRMRQPFLNITATKNLQNVPGEIKNSLFATDQDLSAEPTIYLLSGKIPNIHNCVWPGFSDGFYDTTNDILLFDPSVESNFPRQYTDIKGTTGTAKFGFGDTKVVTGITSGPYNITGSNSRTYYDLTHSIAGGLKVILPDTGEVNDGRLIIIKNNEASTSTSQFPYINVVNNSDQNTTIGRLSPGQAGLFILDQQNSTEFKYVGRTFTDDLELTDDHKITFGRGTSAGPDMEIYHDSTSGESRIDTLAGLTLDGITYPTADGSSGQSIITDGSGNLTFGTAAGTGITAVVQDTTPQLGGDLDLNSHDITGTGNINNTGTITTDGLTVDASTAVVQASNAGGTTSFEISNTNGVSTANNKSALYLSATGAEANAARIESDFTGSVGANHAQDLKFYYVGSGSSPVLGQKIANNGDISFYNSAGTSQDLFWDASTSRLGLGTTAPSNKLDIKGTVGFEATNSTNKWLAYTYTDNSLRLNYNGAGADEVVINSSGNVDVGGVFTVDVANEDAKITGATPGLEFVENDSGGSRMRMAWNTSGSFSPTLYQSLYGDTTSTYGGINIQTRASDGSGNQVVYAYDPINDRNWWGTRAAGDVRMQLQSDGTFNVRGGDVSFENSAQTSDDFYWDASTSRLGLGTTSPDNQLHVYKGASGHSWSFDGGDGFILENSDSVSINIATPSTNSANILFSDADARGQGRIVYDHSSDYMGFHTAGVGNERMRIDSSGQVGIGGSPSGQKFEVIEDSGDATMRLRVTDATSNQSFFFYGNHTSPTQNIYFGDSTNTAAAGIRYLHSNDSMLFTGKGNGTTMATFDSAGNLSLTGNLTVDAGVSGTIDFGNVGSAYGRLYADSTGTYVGSYTNHPLILRTNNTERMQIDSSGTVLTGLNIHLRDGATTRGKIELNASDTDDLDIKAVSLGSNLKFFTVDTERMRIDSSGNLLVGTSSNLGTGSEGVEIRGDYGGIITARNTASTAGHHTFINSNGTVGLISTTGTSTNYGVSSDQRLKDNIVDAPSASDDIDAIQVRSFDWKADGSHQKYGMVAQELQGVAPEAVIGDADSEEMMAVDYSKLVPMLVKEIQSLRARVAQLEND